MAGVVVLDATVLIAFFKADDPFHTAAATLVPAAIARGDEIVASELTIAEYLVGAVANSDVDRAEEELADLGLGRHDLPPSFAPGLARIQYEARMKLPDAAVLLTAVDATEGGTVAVSIATFDERLRAAAVTYGITPAPGTVTPE